MLIKLLPSGLSAGPLPIAGGLWGGGGSGDSASPGVGVIGSSRARLTEKRPTVVSVLVVTWKRPILEGWPGGAGRKPSTTSTPDSHSGGETLCSVFSGLERLEDEEEVDEEVVEEDESLEVVGGSREESSAANDTWNTQSEKENRKKQRAISEHENVCQESVR